VVASAQHPIALGALFVVVIPCAFYLTQMTRRWYWSAASLLLLVGAFATASRTAVLMLVIVAFVYLVLRTRETLRMWPVVLPAVVVVQLLMPGTLRTLYEGFFPKEGLIAVEAAGPVGSSRITSLHAGLKVVEQRPLLGGGYGSRIVSGPQQNSFIVDNGWLSVAMEVGLLGVLAWLWFFLRFIRVSGGAARNEEGIRGWLFVALTASVAAYAVGMATYDAPSFIQVTLVMFLLVGLGCAALTHPTRSLARDADRRRTSSRTREVWT
jgi:O-antigen ligase